jgi:hypothetical protein
MMSTGYKNRRMDRVLIVAIRVADHLFSKRQEAMVLSCSEIRRQLSNFIDDDVSPGTRQAFDTHLLHCGQCAAIVDGMRNILALIADDRLFPLPTGFSERLYIRIQREIATL